MVIKFCLKNRPPSPDLCNQKDDHQFYFFMWPNSVNTFLALRYRATPTRLHPEQNNVANDSVVANEINSF